ncbi:beta-1,3-galactosyltransferase 5-like [Lytechinus variegatus]|uniref:beta-1,3-galactosyltransferase 5-like n=1 Tax=Lytechinus variegatus TaxID=7654 RepID=UPI001BB1D6C1|nr:beta-1,3-galactosyltransferase 5-like [Lytechinus variegatus]
MYIITMRNRTRQNRLQSSLVLSEVLTSMSSYGLPKCSAKISCAMVTLSVFLLVSFAWMFLLVVDQNPYGFGWLRTVHWTPGTLQVDSYDFPINPMDTCKEGITRIKLLVLVKSAPSHRSHRDAIRETYASGIKEYRVSARVLFVLGNTEDEQDRKAIGVEAELYGDVLQVDFTDHYYNLTIKLVMSLKWVVNFCRDTEFVMSIDDDVMLDVVTLVQDLEALPMERQSDFFLGKPNTYPPNRNVFSKWYIPRELYPEDTYPVSPFGHGYVMSQDVVQKLYEASTECLPRVPFDDVYCGMLLQRRNIEIVNRLNFYKELHPKRRSKDYVMLELSEGAMKRTWESMRLGTLSENLPNFTCTNSVLFWLILLSLLIIIIVKYFHHASIDHQITLS